MTTIKKAVVGVLGLAALLLVLGVTTLVIVRTDWFRAYVRQKIISSTEEATGGKVDIGAFSLDVSHLRAVVTDFVIHGTEPAGSPPLVSAARVEVDFRLFTSLRHFLDITFLGVQKPHANLMVFADGRTNIPVPKQTSSSNTTALETMVDLAVGHFDLSDGLLVFNSQKQPLNLQGNNLRAQLWFNTLRQSYSGQLAMDPIYVVSGRNTPVRFRLTLPVSLERDLLSIQNGGIQTDGSNIAINASVTNLRHPKLTAHLNGHIALADVKNAGDLPLVLNTRKTPSSMDLDANAAVTADSIQVIGLRLSLGHSTLEASGPLKDPKGAGALQLKTELALGELGRLGNVSARPDGTLTLNASAKIDAANRYEVAGNLMANHLSFVEGNQRITNINLTSAIHADPRLVELQGLRLAAWGGEFHGDISLEDLAKYKVNGSLAHLDVQTVARVLGEKLPYDGIVSGSINASGDVNSPGVKGILAAARLSISPGRRGIPISGHIEANYNGSADTVVIANSFVALPNTRLTLNGSLNKALKVTLTSRDLNDLLAAASPDKSPLVFNGGQAVFAGTVSGNLTSPRISGRIDLTRFVVEGRQFQSLGADVTASASQAVLRNGTLNRKTTNATFAAELELRNWKPLPNNRVSADATVQTSDLGDLVALAGMPSAGYAGSLTATARVNGTVGNPQGAIQLQASSGMLDGNKFDEASMQASLADQLVTIPAAYITSGSSRVNLSGEYQHPRDSFTTGHVHAHLKSTPVNLADVRYVQQTQPNSGGTVQVDADVTGDLTAINQETGFLLSKVNADLSAKGVKLDGQTYGDLTATARTAGNTVSYNAASNFAGSNLRVTGSTQLVRDYPTSADATIDHLPVSRVLAVAKQSAVPARGNLSGTVHFSGTQLNPTGKADLDLANAVIYDEPLDHLRLAADYEPGSLAVTRLEALEGTAQLDLSGRFDHPLNDLKSGSLQFKIQSSRIDLGKLRNVQKLRPGIGGTLQITGDGAGTLRAGESIPQLSSLNADIRTASLSFQNRSLGDLKLKAGTAAGNRLTLALDSNLAGSTIHGQGSGQLGGDYPVDARVSINNVTWARLQPLLGPAGGDPAPFDAAADGVITVKGPAMKTDQLQGSLQLTRFTVDSRPRPGTTKSIGLRNQGPIELTLDKGTVKIASAHLTGPQTDIQATGTASLIEQTSNLNVTAQVNLALLENLDSDIVSSGEVAMNASVRGGIASPRINGQIKLQKASLFYTGVPNGISNATGEIVLNGTNATIRTLNGESGGGNIAASGFVSFSDQLRFGLRSRASNVRVRVQQGVSVVSDADIRLTGTMTGSTLSGSVTVNQVTYAPRTDIGAMLSLSNQPVESASAPSPLLDNMKLDIRVRTSPALGVQAAVAENLQGTADLRVRGTASQPGVLGRITVTEGQLVFFGSTYTVNSGSIAFYNPLRIDPILNVNLETQTQGVDVVLTVTGPIDNMKLSYTSDPPLQFQEIVGLLAAGSTPTSDPTLLANQPAQPSQSFEQMGESAIVGKALADPVTSRLQRVFGITQLKVDPAFVTGSQLPTARVTFRQQISSNVTFTYTSALDDPNSTIIRAEWAFNPRYSAVLTRDQNGLVSMVLYYKRHFR